MTQTMQVVPERLETIVLARLALGGRNAPVVAALAKLTLRYKPTTLSDAQWHEQIEGAVQRLAARGVIDGERRVVQPAELEVRVGPHAAKKWEQWTDRLLPAAALGMRLDDRAAGRRLALADGWVSAVAARALDLWRGGPPPTLKLLGDALIWRELGLTGTPEACPPKLRAHFLRHHIAMTDGTPSQLVRQIASHAVGAPNVGSKAIRDAIVRSWLIGTVLGTGAAAPEPPAAQPPAAQPPAGQSLIEAARRAAQDARDGVFGDRKVFIASVWHALRERAAWATLALDDFKAQLVAAHRNQELVLARADYVSAMDPALVAASETQTDGATFHFIVREPNP